MTARQGYEEVAVAYDAWVGADEDPDETLIHLTGECREQQVLSLACGQGRDARMLAARGARVTSVDASPKLIELAAARESNSPLGIEYLVDDAQRLATVADATFDGVVCHMSLMDIPDLDATLRAVRRVLRAGGWLVRFLDQASLLHAADGR